MAKIEVTIDEKWPVFEFIQPKAGCEEYQYDIPDEMYKDYLYVMQRYYEFQLKLQAMYDNSHGQFHKRFCGVDESKGADSCNQCDLLKIRAETA